MSLYLNKPSKYIVYTIEKFDEDDSFEDDSLEEQIEEINRRNKLRKMRDKRLRQINSEVQGQLEQDQKLQLLNQLQHQQNNQMVRTYEQRTNSLF